MYATATNSKSRDWALLGFMCWSVYDTGAVHNSGKCHILCCGEWLHHLLNTLGVVKLYYVENNNTINMAEYIYGFSLLKNIL